MSNLQLSSLNHLIMWLVVWIWDTNIVDEALNEKVQEASKDPIYKV